MTGTKAELVVRILEALNLSAPIAATARLVDILHLERCGVWDGPTEGHVVLKLVERLTDAEHLIGWEVETLAGTSMAAARAKLAAAGIRSLPALKAMVEDVEAKQSVIKAKKSRGRRRYGRGGLWYQHKTCRCGNAVVAGCANGCCGDCCRYAGRECDLHCGDASEDEE